MDYLSRIKVLRWKRSSKNKDPLTTEVYKKSFIITCSPSWSKPHMVPPTLKNTFSLQWIRVCHPSAILRCSSDKQPMGVTCFTRCNSHTLDLDLQSSIPQSLTQILTCPNSALKSYTCFPTKSAHHGNFHFQYNCCK